MIFKAKINSCSTEKISVYPTYSGGGNDYLLKSTETIGKEVTVIRIWKPSGDGCSPRIAVNVSGKGDYNVTFSDVRVYEGAFLNPPDIQTPGLVSINRSGIANDWHFPYRTITHNVSGKSWIRVARLCGIGMTNSQLGFKFNKTGDLGMMSIWEGYVIRPWTHGRRVAFLKIRAGLTCTNSGSNPKYSYTLEAQRSCDIPSETTQLKNVRIAYSEDTENYDSQGNICNTVWLEVQSTYQSPNNNIWIAPIFVMNNLSGVGNSTMWNFNTANDKANLNYGDDDTTIVSISATEAGTAFTIS